MRTIIMFALVLNFIGTPSFQWCSPTSAREVLQMEAAHYGLTQSSFPAGVMVGTLSRRYPSTEGWQAPAALLGNHWARHYGAADEHHRVPNCIPTPVPPWPSWSVSRRRCCLSDLQRQVNVPLNVLMQETVPDHYRGRVFGLVGSLVQMLVPISMALAGVLVDVIPAAYFLLLCGTATVALGAAMGMSASIGSLFQEQELESEPRSAAAHL